MKGGELYEVEHLRFWRSQGSNQEHCLRGHMKIHMKGGSIHEYVP